MSGAFVLVMASTILQKINREIGPSGSFTWIAITQILGAEVMSLSVGRLSDIYEWCCFLLVGKIVPAVTYAVAATAKDINTIIGASAVIRTGSARHQLAWSCLPELVSKSPAPSHTASSRPRWRHLLPSPPSLVSTHLGLDYPSCGRR